MLGASITPKTIGSATLSPRDISPLVEIKPETSDDLRSALIYAYYNFDTYRRLFAECSIVESDLTRSDVYEVLRQTLPLNPNTLDLITNESITTIKNIVDMEVSSGTTGTPKRRVITAEDEKNEIELLARLFSICQVKAEDRVVCVDTGPLTLMACFANSLELLGVSNVFMYSVSPAIDTTIQGLVSLNPTVIITIPSIVDRYLRFVKEEMSAGAQLSSLSKIIYVGEPLAQDSRLFLEQELNIEVFGYYGSSETSALGIECVKHNGTHLLTDMHLFELLDYGSKGNERDLLVTTLHQDGLPLVRHSLGDIILPISGSCACGMKTPLVYVLGRHDDTASILGSKISYMSLVNHIYENKYTTRDIDIILTSEPIETITLKLPTHLRKNETLFVNRILAREPELAFLIEAGFARIKCEYVLGKYFDGTRKKTKFKDLRKPTVVAG